MSGNRQSTRLRALFNSEEPFEFACPPTVRHAQMLEAIGYPAVYIAASAVIGGITGRPDDGTITMSESVQISRYFVQGLNIPVWVDADVCFGGLFATERAVEEYIHAGVAGVTIEDQPPDGKRFGGMAGKEVLPIEDAVAKFRIAADTRDRLDPDFVIVARTDALAAINGGGLEEAIKRLQAYKRAGADVLYLEAPRSYDEVRAVRAAIEGPMKITSFGLPEELSAEKAKALGISAYVYLSATRAQTQAYWALHSAIRQDGAKAIADFRAALPPAEGMERLRLGVLEKMRATEEKYLSPDAVTQKYGETRPGQVYSAEQIGKSMS